jgi:AcrR family transcriptional regulator
METTKIDRRVARTRGMLQQALQSLILQKAYEAITVEDICATANIARSTFYAHYTSKDDLKRSGLRRALSDLLGDALAKPNESGAGRLGFSLGLFEHARDHLHHYRALVGSRGGAVALGTIRQILSDLVRNEFAAIVESNSADAMPRELVVQYIVGAYMAVLTWWLDGGAKLPPERMDAMFRRLVAQGMTPSPPERGSY